MPIRPMFYIDGFNFYNVLRTASSVNPIWKSYYWLDLIKFAKQFLNDSHEPIQVKYFTASPLDPGEEKRQSALFKANKYLNGDRVQFIKGKYSTKPIRCQAKCKKKFTIHEEKRTDVNISVEMVGDCAFGKTDLLVLITADSDLIPPIEYIFKNFTDKRIKVFFPPCRKSADLMQIIRAKGYRVVFLETNELKFRKARMPQKIALHGRTVQIPAEWNRW